MSFMAIRAPNLDFHLSCKLLSFLLKLARVSFCNQNLTFNSLQKVDKGRKLISIGKDSNVSQNRTIHLSDALFPPVGYTALLVA